MWSQLKHLCPGRDGSITVRLRSADKLHYLGSFKSEEAGKAKKALANFLKVPVGKLPRKRPRAAAVRKAAKYRYVYYNAAGVIYAKIGKAYLGSFETEVAAAEAIAQYLKKKKKKEDQVSINALEKTGARQEGPQQASARFQLLKSIFSKWLPNDLVSSCNLGKTRVARLLVAAPGPLWMYFILGKETNFRRAILSGWAALDSGKQVGLGSVADSTMFGKPESIDAARAIYNVLLDAVGKINGDIQEHEYWAKHVHVGVNHHSGWLPLLLRLRILEKVSGKKR